VSASTIRPSNIDLQSVIKIHNNNNNNNNDDDVFNVIINVPVTYLHLLAYVTVVGAVPIRLYYAIVFCKQKVDKPRSTRNDS